jgi:hypothetical protein
MRPSLPLRFHLLPPRSMVGQLPLEQHIGVRIPGGQPASFILSITYQLCLKPSKTSASATRSVDSFKHFRTGAKKAASIWGYLQL